MGVTARKRKRKRKDGTVRKFWEVEVYKDNVAVERQYFDTAAAAHVFHNEMKRKYDVGDGVIGKNYTFGDLFQEYVENRFQRLSKASQQARSSRFRYFTESPIADVKMRQFSSKVVDAWLNWLRDHHTAQNKSRRSFEQELKLMRSVLSWYKDKKDRGFIVPIDSDHREKCFYKPILARVPDYYMKVHEIPLWLDQLKTNRPDPVYFRLALFMVLTGCRMGEASGLCWDAVDLKSKSPTVRIVRTLSWDYRTKKPYFQQDVKTEASRRVILLPAVLAALLKEMWLECGGKQSDAVFLNAKGEFLRDNTIRDNFNSCFKACGFNWRGTHIARHTFGTMALVATHSLPAVQAVLGHTTSKQTQEYAKIAALHANDTADRTARWLGLGSGKPGPNHGLLEDKRTITL